MTGGSAGICQVCGGEFPSEELIDAELYEMSPGGSNYLGSSFYSDSYWSSTPGPITGRVASGVFKDYRRWSVDSKNQYKILRGIPVLPDGAVASCGFSVDASKTLVIRVTVGKAEETSTPADPPVPITVDLGVLRGIGYNDRFENVVRVTTASSIIELISPPNAGDGEQQCEVVLRVDGADWWFDAAQVMEPGDDFIYTVKGPLVDRVRKKTRVRATVCHRCYDDDAMEILG